MSERFGLYTGAYIHAGGTMNLTQIQDFTVNPNTTKSAITPSGTIDAAHVGLGSATPTITFSSQDITNIFADVSITTGLAASGNVTFWWQERAEGGTFIAAATATHMQWQSTGGFLRPTSFSASQDGGDGALVQFEFTPLWDGTNDPVVLTDAVALNITPPAPAFGSRFWLGPVYHAGAALGGITQVDIDPGINYNARALNGDPWPRKGSIIMREPRITFTSIKADVAANLNALSNSAIATGIVVYLRKGAASAGASTTGRVADITANHAKITAAAGDWQLDEASVTNTDDGQVSFSVIPTGTIALDVATAIP